MSIKLAMEGANQELRPEELCNISLRCERNPTSVMVMLHSID